MLVDRKASRLPLIATVISAAMTVSASVTAAVKLSVPNVASPPALSALRATVKLVAHPLAGLVASMPVPSMSSAAPSVATVSVSPAKLECAECGTRQCRSHLRADAVETLTDGSSFAHLC